MTMQEYRTYGFFPGMGLVLKGDNQRPIELASCDFETGDCEDVNQNVWPLAWVEKFVMLDGSEVVRRTAGS